MGTNASAADTAGAFSRDAQNRDRLSSAERSLHTDDVRALLLVDQTALFRFFKRRHPLSVCSVPRAGLAYHPSNDSARDERKEASPYKHTCNMGDRRADVDTTNG